MTKEKIIFPGNPILVKAEEEKEIKIVPDVTFAEGPHDPGEEQPGEETEGQRPHA